MQIAHGPCFTEAKQQALFSPFTEPETGALTGRHSRDFSLELGDPKA